MPPTPVPAADALAGHGGTPVAAPGVGRAAVHALQAAVRAFGRRGLVGLALAAAVVVAGVGVVTANAASPRPAPRAAAALTAPLRPAPSAPVALAPAAAAPAPAPFSLASAPALAAHEVFGFAPYWTLPQAGAFPVADYTTIAYFALDVAGDGSVAEDGAGWDGYQSQDLAALVDRAHAAGTRVVLTLSCFDQAALDALSGSPAAAARLAQQAVALVAAKHLDGVNLDLEGTGPDDRAGLDRLVGAVDAAVKAADPHWQVTVDTYASSAGDPGGFYDVAGLAKVADALFVMAYEGPGGTPVGSSFSDLTAVRQYLAAVPARQVILGVPFYGEDWPTAGPELGAAAAGAPTALTDAQIAGLGGPRYFDPSTDSAWTAYQSGGQWHQVFYDDPTSLLAVHRLAQAAGLAGVGVWALGMDGDDPQLIGALLGFASPVGYAAAPTGPSPAAAAPAGAPPSPAAPPVTAPAAAGGPPAAGGASPPPTGPTSTAPAPTTTTTTAPVGELGSLLGGA